MKHFLLFFSVFYLAQASTSAQTQNAAQNNAQGGKPFYYYGESLNSKLIGAYQDHDLPVAVRVDTYNDVVRATIFEPKSQKILAKIRGRKMSAYGDAAQSVLLDSSFALKIPGGKSILFDAESRTTTVLDAENIKQKTLSFELKPQDTTLVVVDFYANGQPYYKSIFNRITVYNAILQEDKQNISNLENAFTEISNVSNMTDMTWYYPNGKPQKTTTETERIATDTRDMLPYIFNVYDSTGVRLAENVRLNDYHKGKGVIDLDFNKKGHLVSKTDYRERHKSYIINTFYDHKNDNITDITYRFMDSIDNSIAFCEGKPDGFFRKKAAYKTSKTNIKSNKNLFITPLFEIKKADNGKINEIALLAQNTKWAADACPLKPQYIVQGGYADGLPQGEWQIFLPDSVGNKKSLAVVAHFKNGLPDGVWQAVDAKNDTLANVRYDDGILVSNPFWANYIRIETPEIFFADSLRKAQKRMDANCKIQAAQQHALFAAGQTAVWQRDSTVCMLNMGSSGAYFQGQLFVAVKEWLSPDSLGLMRLRYFYPNNPEIPMSVVRYTAKNNVVDSIATFYSNENEIFIQFEPKNNTLKQLDTGNGRPAFKETTVVNDSIILTKKFYGNGKTVESIRVDSLGYTPNMQQDFFIKSRPKIHFNPDFFNKDIVGKILPRYDYMRLSSLFHTYHAQNDGFTPICVTNTTYFDENAKMTHQKGQNKTIYYKNDGKTIDNIVEDDESEWEGWKKKYNEGIQTTAFYKKGKIEGEETRLDTRDSSKTINQWRKGRIVAEKQYERGRLVTTMQEIRANPSVKKVILYNMDSVKIGEETLEYDPNRLGISNNSEEDILTEGKYYKIDSTNKRYLAAHYQVLDKDKMLLRSWYASGKPQIVYAYYQSAISFKTSRLRQWILDPEPLSDFDENRRLEITNLLIQHENAKLLMQGIGFGVACAYDSLGNIEKEEVINRHNSPLEYPKADEKETCHWEKLPYQEGKMENGRRVGKWNAYYRTAKKQLQYSIEYNKEGVIIGEIMYYDTSGALTNRWIMHRNDTISCQIEYENSAMQHTELNTKNKHQQTIYYPDLAIYKQKTYENDTTTSIWYATESGKIEHKTIEINDFEIDSSFTKNGKLLSASSGEKYELKRKTSLNEANHYEITYTLPYKTVANSQKAYMENLATETVVNDACMAFYVNKLDNTTLQPQDTLLSRLKLFKNLSFEPSFKTADFRTAAAIAEAKANSTIKYERDIFPNKYYPNSIMANDYTIKDSFGQTVKFTPIRKKTQLLIALEASKNATPIYYNTIELSPSASSRCESRPTISNDRQFQTLSENKVLALQISANRGLQTTLRYPSRLLHPINSTEDALFVFHLNTLGIVKNYPHQYISLYPYYNKKDESKQVQIDALNKIPVRSFEKIVATNEAKTTQIYGIGSTSLQIIPEKSCLINSLPLKIDTETVENFYDEAWDALRFPHHQNQPKNQDLQPDTFLLQPKIRTLWATAYLSFPPLLPDFIRTNAVLIDNTEINGSFDFDFDTINPKSLSKQCKAQHIDLILMDTVGNICKKTKKGGKYVAHFRYKP